MYRAVLIGCLVFSFSLSVFPQEDAYFTHLNSTTYEQYLKNDWKSLIRLGNIGLRKGLDYYYLRMRIGIAYFETGNYRKAVRHFHSALLHNADDPVALEYLYYSYLYSGRVTDADLTFFRMGPFQKEKIRPDPRPFISSVALNYQYSTNENIYGTMHFQDVLNTTSEGDQSVLRTFNHFNLGLEHKIGSRFSLFHAFTYLNKTEGYYFQNAASRYLIPARSLAQNQYYISGNYLAARGLNITAAFHLLYLRGPGYSISGQGAWGNTTLVQPTSELLTVTYLSLLKDLGPVTLGISSSYASLEKRNLWQKDLSFVFYPLGNLNLYSVSRITWNSVLIGNIPEEDHVIMNQTLGFRLAPWWWTEFSYTLGNLFYYVDKHALIIYNSPEIYKQQYGISFIFPVTGKNTDIYIRYFYSTGNSYLIYSDDALSPDHTLDISIHSINGGIKWNF